MKPRLSLRHYVLSDDPADPRRRLFLGPLGVLTSDFDLAVEFSSLGRARAAAETLRRRYPSVKFGCVSF